MNKKQIFAVILMVIGVIVFFHNVPSERGDNAATAFTFIGIILYGSGRHWLARLNDHRLKLPESYPRFKLALEKTCGWVGGIVLFIGSFCMIFTSAVYPALIMFFIGLELHAESGFLFGQRVYREKAKLLEFHEKPESTEQLAMFMDGKE